jgi:leucine-rich repeat protein SHOC2
LLHRFQKVEHAKKLGVLSLSEHELSAVPIELFSHDIVKSLKTLDLSKNQLSRLDERLQQCALLKTLMLDHNHLCAGCLQDILPHLEKLQNLSLSHNRLASQPLPPHARGGTGDKHVNRLGQQFSNMNLKRPGSKQQRQNQPDLAPAVVFPPLPVTLPAPVSQSLRQLNLSYNSLAEIPQVVFTLRKLEKLHLAGNTITLVSVEIAKLKDSLQELNLDDNKHLSSLPAEVGQLSKLKVLSLQNNQFRVVKGSAPCLPASLFTDTPVIDLNLHGNPMTNTELNTLPGFGKFLERRTTVKTKTMFVNNLTVCGLE